MGDSSRHIFLIVILSLAILFGLSSLPWSRWTGNRIKDFNLLEDLYPTAKEFVSAELQLDPEFEALMNSQEALAATQEELQPDTAKATTTAASTPKEPLSVAPRLKDGTVAVETYSSEGYFPNFSKALLQADSRPVRIAFLGDSFIEGDILTQNLRDGLQENYGGRGVGYMNMQSEIPGFRHSVHQSGNGWEMVTLRDMKNSDTIRVLSGEYGKATGAASSTYKGSKFSPRTQGWNRTSFIFIAPAAGTVTLIGSNGETVEQEVEPSTHPQILTLDAETTSARLKTNVEGIIGLGTYLTDATGIQLDCMSVRGYSGISHRKLNKDLTGDLAALMPYDLIIFEYGMNVLTEVQKDYTAYGKALVESIKRTQECYPQADILVLGISDRGVKQGGEVHSLETCAAMTKAQRDAAIATGSHFWDMREAMGGQDAVVQWRKDKYINADYIHLNHDGGREIANRLLHAIQAALNE